MRDAGRAAFFAQECKAAARSAAEGALVVSGGFDERAGGGDDRAGFLVNVLIALLKKGPLLAVREIPKPEPLLRVRSR